ncbi:hypothetical protein ACFDB8_13230, partial [Enterococcus lactis]|uniref:hypothetical protein n=1 Tax=Enterococcus lactis TaxID=357441 RepID=UPI0039A69A37
KSSKSPLLISVSIISVVKLVMRKSSYKISVVVTLILQNGLSFYLPKISIYTKYFTLSKNSHEKTEFK